MQDWPMGPSLPEKKKKKEELGPSRQQKNKKNVTDSVQSQVLKQIKYYSDQLRNKGLF